LTTGPRLEIYRQAMEDAGLESQTISTQGVRPTAVQQALAALSPMPEAIVCMNDDLALAASVALPRLGYRVGADVALVGFDGLEETEHCPVPITTVKQPIDEMCALTFEFLKSQMEDPTAPIRQQILKPTLVIRESTQP
jgi:DNA-binding LacI/PurR family transcriptional regulator